MQVNGEKHVFPKAVQYKSAPVGNLTHLAAPLTSLSKTDAMTFQPQDDIWAFFC